MKNYTQYLLEEANKTYDFKIKISELEVNDELLDKVEHALSAFEIANMSKPKRLLIKAKNLDFPSKENCEITLLNVSLKYPCNDEQVRVALGTQGRIPLANIVVVPKNSPEELRREEDESAEDETTNKKKEPILTKELENISGGQIQVGQQRLESMLKELEQSRIKTEFAAKGVGEAKTSNDLPQNNKTPVATKSHNVKGR